MLFLFDVLFDSKEELIFFSFMECSHLTDIIIKLSLQYHYFIEQKLFLFSLYFVYSHKTFLLALLLLIF